MKTQKAFTLDAKIGDHPIEVIDTGYKFKGCHIFLETNNPYIIRRFTEFAELIVDLQIYPSN